METSNFPAMKEIKEMRKHGNNVILHKTRPNGSGNQGV